MNTERIHAHQMLDRLGPGQFEAITHLLETMVGEDDRAPVEDRDTLSNAERKAIDEADLWLRHNAPIAHEDILAEFGLTMADWEKMSAEPQPGETPRHHD